MLPRCTSTNPAVLSYYTMRRVVGILALALPFALAVGSILTDFLTSSHLPHPLLQRSISDYYYTPMRDLYVGSLCAIATFLVCSRGYDLHDEIAGYIAGACASGVAFFPSFNPRSSHYTQLDFAIGLIHTAFAALMFLVLSYICIFRFRRSAPDRRLTRGKRHRNRIYQGSGLVMIACMIAMVAITIRAVIAERHPSHWLFWSETVALCAFGFAWLTKGEGVMRDKPHERQNADIHHRLAKAR